ncbi:hypothetical protein C8R43DRAFT_519764 [Mycena crocata]|nr:hypothetical protein C8R43DRAFT_519764 [Mycena crocata]
MSDLSIHARRECNRAMHHLPKGPSTIKSRAFSTVLTINFPHFLFKLLALRVMFKVGSYLSALALVAAVVAAMANAEGCYNGGNSNAKACYDNFDFCGDVAAGVRSECHSLDSKTHCDFSVTGPAGIPDDLDCVYAMSQLGYFCDEHGGLKTQNGYQYKLDPNDGGSC